MAQPSRKVKNLRRVAGQAARLRSAVFGLAARRGKAVKLAELADKVGKLERGKPYAISTVSEWLNGKAEPSLATLAAFAEFTGTPLAALVADPEEDEPSARAA